jgi:hypothetical protein
LKRSWFFKVRKRRIELWSQCERIKQLTDTAYRLGFAACIREAVYNSQSPGKAKVNTPILGKIAKRGLQTDYGLFGAMVVLEVPTAAQSPKPTVTLFLGPRFQQLPAGIWFPGVSQRGHEHLAGIDMFGVAHYQVPELGESRVAPWIIGAWLGAHPPQVGYTGIDVGGISVNPPLQRAACQVIRHIGKSC